MVQPRLTAIDGVQRADILGGRTFALRAWLKPDRMAALDVSPAQVRAALAANNHLAAVGQSKGNLIQIDLTTTTNLTTVEEFKRLVLRQSEGTLVRLEDVADVTLGADDYDSDVRFSGKQAVFMGVWVLPSANALTVIAKVRTELEAIRRDLPTGMEASIAYDSTRYIDSAIRDVTKTLLETVLTVMVVIFLFLGSFRTVLVPVAAIPLSLIGAVFLLQVLGFTLNLLTLLAIVLSVGLVVDDAIVVVENVERHVRMGKTPLRAALDAAHELVGPIVAMTITLAAVYVPIGFQGGLTGALFREFAFTLAGAVFISGIVALTLSPMMSSKLLRPGGIRVAWPAPSTAPSRRSSRGTSAFSGGRSRRVLASTRCGSCSPCSSSRCTCSRPSSWRRKKIRAWCSAPSTCQPTRRSSSSLLSPNRSSISIAAEPEFDQAFQITFPYAGFGGLLVKPWGERKRSIFRIQDELAYKLMGVAGIRAPAFLPSPLPSAGTFPVEFVIASTADHEQLVAFAQQLALEG